MVQFKIDDKTFRRIQLPILVQDDNWLNELETFENETILELIKMSREQLRLEEELETELRQHQKEKKALMEKILEWSDEANQKNDKKAEQKLEKARNSVLKLNDEIDELQFKLDLIPKDIKKLNEALFHETIDAVYGYISEGKQRLDTLNEEIQEIRKLLGTMYEEKFDLENRVESVYKYLHTTLGKDETDQLDQLFLENKDHGSEK